MKKLGIIAMAFALILGMSQCKKENTTASNDEGAKVPITLNVSGGSRVAVNPGTGKVDFQIGDSLYVASDGKYIGLLTAQWTIGDGGSSVLRFCGEITEPEEGEKLHFYFFGNTIPAETLTEGSTTGCSVVISDQTQNYPVISYSPSVENYETGKTDYNATLLNKCALVKFNVTTSSGVSPTCITECNNKVTVDFTTNEFSFSQDGEGLIALPAGNGDRWAILLPQDEVTDAEASSLDGVYVGTCDPIPAIAENDYLTDGIIVVVDVPTINFNNLFSVDDDGHQVYFSQGNLQYQASTNTWRFAENQYDIVGADNSNISETYDGWIDLFGWGTSGYNHGAVCYQPWSTNTSYSNYYAYGEYNYNLYDQTGQADWGYNAISNGGNQENSGWRTLSKDEWAYIFNSRNTTSGIRFAKGKVNNRSGVVLLPDNWDESYYPLVSTNGQYSGYNNNISVEDWTNIFEPNGAVFLPVTGYRNGYSVENYGYDGYYWSSSYQNSPYSYTVYFSGSRLNPAQDGRLRSEGRSVRLVRDVE